MMPDKTSVYPNPVLPLVSIIVPIYNVADYLQQCVLSILNQDYKNIEIILVNDGSTDGSGEVAKKLSSKDGRIKLLHKENGGVSSARNVGLDNSTGDYVMFIDSDDWIDREMIDEMVHHMDRMDMVTCRMRYVKPNGATKEVPYNYHPIGQVLERDSLNFEIVKELLYGGGGLHCRLIRRSIIENNRFIESMRISEDQEWLLRLASKMNSGTYAPGTFYNVRIRPGSATTKSIRTDIDDIEVVSEQVKDWAYNSGRLNNEYVLNVLFVRSRLQYSAALISGAVAEETNSLRKRMKQNYSNTKKLPFSERVKYFVALLPRKTYLSVRGLLKSIRGELV